MPTGADRILAFLHPTVALVSLFFLFHVGSLGLRSRERGGAALRPRHARLAPYALVLMVLNLLGGLASTWRWRPDIDLGQGAHFTIGVAASVALGGAALLSRRLPDPRARRIHPILGMLGLLLAALQVFFGLPLLPL